jgi:hypothetical protein
VCFGLLFCACSFDQSGLNGGDSSTVDAAATDSSPSDGVPGMDALISNGAFHVPDDGQYPGGADVTLSGNVNITTGPGAPSIDTMPTLPSGVVFDVWMQPCMNAPCPEVAVLHTRAFTVGDGAFVRVLGSRPLVVIAGGVVTISGALDASARNVTPGASGFAPAMGPGAGTAGMSNQGNDGGGGGAGFGKPGGGGGDGGNGSMRGSGGNPGPMVDRSEVVLLQGGSGGGPGGAGGCSTTTSGGAGGGAVELFSTVSITIGTNGIIDVGGGGGIGGSVCLNDDSAGGGGGAGGVIFLQSPIVLIMGTLTANGGGGGGGASGLGGGGNGGDALDMNAAATAGTSGGSGASDGGAGGFGTTNAGNAMGATNNGGGGGGGVGRVRILHRMPYTMGGTISPPASVGTY